MCIDLCWWWSHLNLPSLGPAGPVMMPPQGGRRCPAFRGYVFGPGFGWHMAGALIMFHDVLIISCVQIVKSNRYIYNDVCGFILSFHQAINIIPETLVSVFGTGFVHFRGSHQEGHAICWCCDGKVYRRWCTWGRPWHHPVGPWQVGLLPLVVKTKSHGQLNHQFFMIWF